MVAQGWGQRELRGKDFRESGGNFRGDGNVHYLDCSTTGLTDTHVKT